MTFDPRPPSVNVEVNARMNDAAIEAKGKKFAGFLGVTRIKPKAYSCFDTEAHAQVFRDAGGPPAP